MEDENVIDLNQLKQGVQAYPRTKDSAPPVDLAHPQISKWVQNPAADSVFTIPEPDETRFSRVLTSHSLVGGRAVQNRYVTTGLFPSDAKRATKGDLVAVPQPLIDADLCDYVFVNMLEGELRELREICAPHVHKAKGSVWADASSITPAIAIKFALHILDDAELAVLKGAHRAEVSSYVLGEVGVEPTIELDSGYGLHLYHRLPNGQGRASGSFPPDVLQGHLKRLIQNVNDRAGYSLLDPAVVDVGTRMGREVGDVNTKGARPRRVAIVGGDPTARLDLWGMPPLAPSFQVVGPTGIDDKHGTFRPDLRIEVPRSQWVGTVDEWMQDGPSEPYNGGLKAHICCPVEGNSTDGAWIYRRGHHVTIHCDVQHHEHALAGRTRWDLRVFERGDQVELAAMLRSEMPKDSVFDEGSIWACDPESRIWQEVPPPRVIDTVANYAGLLGPKGPMMMSSTQANGALRFLTAKLSTPDFFDGRPLGFAFSNGFYRQGSGLEPLVEDHRVRETDVADYAYDTDAQCPGFLAFLGQVFEGDADADTKMVFLGEYIGLAMLGLAPTYQLHPVFYGRLSANGKSVVVEVICSLFPVARVISSSPSSWGGRFGKSQLLHAMLNVVPELSTGQFADSGVVKAVLSGDAVEIEKKMKDPVTVRSRCAHVFATNTLPRSPDRTEGFFRRFLVVSFNNRFTLHPRGNERKADVQLATRLKAERQGIATWALQKAEAMIACGKYTIPPSHHELSREWRLECNGVAAFVEERVETAANEKLRAGQFSARYRDWARDQGLRALTDAQVKKAMLDLGYAQGRDNNGYFWRGLQWTGQFGPGVVNLQAKRVPRKA